MALLVRAGPSEAHHSQPTETLDLHTIQDHDLGVLASWVEQTGLPVLSVFAEAMLVLVWACLKQQELWVCIQIAHH